MFAFRLSIFVRLSFFLCFVLTGCYEKNAPNNSVILTNSQDVIQITKWKLLHSSFIDEEKQGSILDGNLPYHLVGHQDEINLEKLSAYTADNPIVYSQDAGLTVSQMLGKDNNAVAYFFCNLESKGEQEVNLLFSGVQQAMLWLNNEMIYKTDWKSVQAKYYEEYIPVKLKKGRNLLLLKIGMTDRKAAVSRWTFNAFISRPNYAKENYLMDYKFTFLKRSVVKDSLELYLGPYIHSRFKYCVLDHSDSIIFSGNDMKFEKNLRRGTGRTELHNLKKNDLYKIYVFLDGDTLSQDFLYGDNDNIVDNIHKKYESFSRQFPQIENNDSQIALDRLDKIKNRSNSADTYPTSASHWDLSRVYFYKELSNYLKKLERTGSYQPYQGFIASYTSQIDNSTQLYSYHIPERLLKGDKKVPLIFIMPFTYYPNRYLDTWGISNFDQIWWESKLGAENGFGLVWVNMRSHPGINDIAMTAFQEIMNSLRSRINIDEDRLFLMGNSASSIKALTLATRFPDNFAGCMFYNPDLDLEKFSQTYKNIENLSGMAMFFQHSTRDEIVPIKKAQSFFSAVKPYSLRSRFLMVDDNTHFVSPKDTYRAGFHFMAQISKQRSKKIRISTEDLRYAERLGIKILEKLKEGKANLNAHVTNGTIELDANNIGKIELDLLKLGVEMSTPITIVVNGEIQERYIQKKHILLLNLHSSPTTTHLKTNDVEGPINHFFAQPFKAIYHADNLPYAQLFEKKWKKTYFTECPMIMESSITEDVLKNNNILLFGMQTKSPLIQSIIKNLPISKKENYIYFRGKEWDSNRTFISFIYPNPLNPKKYVYLIEYGNNLTESKIWERDFTNDFDFDYEIIEVRNTYHKIVDKGNFSNSWD